MKILKNESAIFFVCKVIAGILGLVAISVRTHFIDQTIYSNYVLITQSISLAISLIITWVVESAGRYFEQTKDKKIYFTTYITNYLISFCIGFLLLFILNIFSGGNLIVIYLPFVASLLFVNGFVELSHQILRMSHKTLAYGGTLLISSTLNVVVFILLPKESGVSTLLLAMILTNLVVTIFMFFYMKLYLLYLPRKYSWKLTKKSLKYAIPLIVVWGCLWIFNSSDTFIINYFVGDSSNGEVAVYNVAHSLTTQSIGVLTGSLTFAVFPKLITQYLSNDKEQIAKNISSQVDICLKICVPACAGLIMVTPSLYASLLDSSYSFGHINQLLIGLFSAITTFSGIENLIVRPWQLEEKTVFMMILYIISAFLNIALDFLFVYLFGFIAAAAVSFVIIFIRTLVIYIIMFKKRNVRFYFFRFLPTIISTIAMVSISHKFLTITHNVYFNLLLTVFVGVLMYGVCIFLLDTDLRKVFVKKGD